MEDVKLLFMRDAFYSKVDPRRRQELSDARMILEDSKAPSNLPEQPIYRQYNQDRFRYHQNSAGSPNWELSEVGDEVERERKMEMHMSRVAKEKDEGE